MQSEKALKEHLEYSDPQIENKVGIKLLCYLLLKRTFDVISSLLGLIVFSPVFLIISIIIKLDSKGPIFFAHNRLGQNGKIIKVYKFRTMCVNAEQLIKKLPKDKLAEFEKNFKLDDDPRITNVGKVLRETSLDELPQLLNILIGNMSVVGPRPIIINELKKYNAYSDKLLNIKPGLTGYWQVNGRSNTSYEDRIKMDMYYINNRSVMLDLFIIIKTVFVVFKRSGAK